MNWNKRFSVAHFDRFHGHYAKTFYDLMKNADPRYLANIHDIYFGKYFEYEYNGVKKRCGNAMGVEASDEQVNWLFKLQEETGETESFEVEEIAGVNLKELEKELEIDLKTLEDIIKRNKVYQEKPADTPKIHLENIKNDIETYFLAMLLHSEIDVIKAFLYNFDPSDLVNQSIIDLLKVLIDYTNNESKFEINKYINSLNENQKTFIENLYIQEIKFDNKELEETINRIRKAGGKEKIKRLTAEIKLAEKQKDNKRVESLLNEIENIKKILL